MKLKIERHRILLIPEDATEVAYIEEVLGLKYEVDEVVCKRVNAMGFGCIAYLEITAKEEK